MNWEIGLIIIIIGAAAWYAGRDLIRTASIKNPDCGKNCDSCPMSKDPFPNLTGKTSDETDKSDSKT